MKGTKIVKIYNIEKKKKEREEDAQLP